MAKKQILFTILFLVIFFGFSNKIFSIEYFMSVDGSDSNDGLTESTGWETFEHAYTVMIGGDILTILDGTYLQELHPPPELSGTESSYTTFQAQNPGNVILAPISIGNDAQEGVIYVCSNVTSGVTSFIHFDGLFAKGVGENPAISLLSMDFATEDQMTHHIKMTRCGAMGSAKDYNVNAFEISFVREILVEDCFAFGFGRKAMQLYGALRITVRRVVVRYDWWEGDEYKPNDPRVNLSTYNTIDAKLENIIAFDAGPHPASTSPDRIGLVASGNQGGGTAIDGSENVDYLGCIVFHNNEFSSGLNGFEVNGGTGSPVKNIRFKDIVIHGADYGFNVQDNVDSIYIENITSIYNNLAGIRVNPYPSYVISNVFIDKSVATDNTYYGINWNENMATVTNSTSVDNGEGVVLEPEYKPVIDYLPTNTPVAGYARGGIVENRYIDGILTSDPLWPWPYEDVIKQFMCNTAYLQEIEDVINNYEGTSISYVPGLCQSGMTLTEYVWSYLGTPLGVESLFPLKAVISKENTVKLIWATASEQNNKGFEIQRSTNAKTWEKIGWVDGNGNAIEQNFYYFIDKTPMRGINYYRYVQVDFNNNLEYSKITSVNFKKHDVNLYPNPVSGILNIGVKSGKVINTVMIYNQMGQELLRTQPINGQIDLSEIQSGMYILKVKIDNELVEKIVIIE